MSHYEIRVTCKAALYTPDRSKVLLTEYGRRGYGLPGGHIEADEAPDVAILREIEEELGVSDLILERKDFWLHSPHSKLVLGFTGTLHESQQFTLQVEEISNVIWVPIIDIHRGHVEVPAYREFILKFQ